MRQGRGATKNQLIILSPKSRADPYYDGPWWLPYYEVYSNRGEAVRREQELKRKKNATSIERIIGQARDLD
jgi:hypothetical protein